MGANTREIAIQFSLESTIYSLLSTILGLAFIYLLLPYFRSVAGKNIPFSLDVLDFIFFLVLTFLIGLLAGSYPAFFLSSFNPALVLKSRAVYKLRVTLVSVLVVFQFSLSLFFKYLFIHHDA